MHTKFSVIALSVAAAFAFTACGQKEEPKPVAASAAPAAPAAKPEVLVQLGHVAPMTGPQAHLGKDNESGARLAIEELNAQGLEIGGAKVTFELLGEDDQADPKQGSIVAQKLVDAKVGSPEYFLSQVGGWISPLKVLTVSAPDGWDLDGMDPLDEDTY